MKYIILSYIFLNPLFFFVDVDQRSIQEVFFQLSSVLVFACGMFFPQKAIKREKLHIWLGIFLIAFVLAWIKSMNGWKFALNLILGLLVYFTTIKTVKREEIPFLIKGIVYLGIIATIYFSFQSFGIDLRGTENVGDSKRIDATSLFFQRSAMGMYFAQILPIIASINLWLTPFFFIPVIYSECISAIIGGAIAYAFFLWFKKRILFWIILPILLIGGIYYGATRENIFGFSSRLPIWQAIVKDITRNPLGYGLDSFANPLMNGQWRYYQDPDTQKIIRFFKFDNLWKCFETADTNFVKKILQKKATELTFLDHPHNEYLWLGYEVGLHALIVLGFIYYYLLIMFKTSRRDLITTGLAGSLLAIVVFSITQFPFHLARVGHLLPVILGLFYIQREE